MPPFLAGIVSQWAAWYGHSIALSTTVTTLHLGGMLLGGGLAIAADRSTLRALRRHHRGLADHLDALESLHGPVLLGLGVTVLTGVGMLLADWETFVDSPIFWVKMGMVLVLMANGAVLRRSAQKLRRQTDSAPLRARVRTTAWSSAVLWFLLLILGATLPTVA